MSRARSGAWQTMRINKVREFAIGGYTPAPRNFDALLVGYYKGRKLMYVAKVRAGFTPASRTSVFKRFRGLESSRCPFGNLPESRRGQWGEGLTADDMKKCLWLKPRLVATIEYLEWTAANHLGHSKFQKLDVLDANAQNRSSCSCRVLEKSLVSGISTNEREWQTRSWASFDFVD